MESDRQSPQASPEAVQSVERLYNAIQTQFPEAVAVFVNKWTPWHDLCIKHMSSPSAIGGLEALTKADEYEKLKNLGPKIIPFIVFKLAQNPENNSHAVFLYNELETDAEYRVEVDESLASSAILRTHGYRVVELNYQRNKIVEEQRRAWREHNERNAVQSATAMFTHCEEYFDLLEMGPSIIGPIMMDYQGRKFNPYWELLHEIVHGHKMGAHAIFVEPLFETWLQWFNYGDHKHVFKYEPTEADRAIYGLNTLEDYEHL